jgi:hypothetical protein
MNTPSARSNPTAHAKRYLKGNFYENKARKILISQGYYVLKSAGSKGAIDILAIGRYHFRAIQIKSGTSHLGRDERHYFLSIPAPRNCVKELWEWKTPGDPPTITKLQP